MRTEQLVASLVADRVGSARPLGRSVGQALLAGAAVSLVIFAVEFKPRVDLAAAREEGKPSLVLIHAGPVAGM